MTVDQLAVLDDRYVINDLVASGGMADVYRATDRVLQRQVAIKILRESAEGSQRSRFVDEARTLAGLNHPGLVTLLDAGFQADRPYLVMELAEGTTLAEAISGEPMDPVEVARIGGELAAALDYAHGSGIVHRDVKPSNVLLCEDGRVLLADFGIARLVSSTEHHTLPGEAIGSPAYLAPEQVAGEPLTPAIDIFSLGLVLLEALTGERAYAGPPMEAALARLTASPEVPPAVADDWRDLVVAMTLRDARERPSAAEVAASLVPVVPTAAAEQPEHTQVLDLGSLTQPLTQLTAEPVLEPENPSRPPVDRRLLGAGIAVAALLLVILIVVLAHGGGSTRSPGPMMPSGVPSNLQQPLDDLARAVEGAQ